MRSRNLRIVMLAFFVAWFGIVLPGHERGIVKLPGYAAANATVDTSCAQTSSCSSCTPSQTSDDKSDSSPPPASGHCAICHLIGILDVPVVVTFALPDPQLLDCLFPEVCDSIASVASLDIIRERGPPLL